MSTNNANVPVAEAVSVVNDPVAAAVAVSVDQRQCRGCGVLFTPAPRSNQNTRMGMRCAACNRDYDQNFVRDTVRGSCQVS